MIDLCILIPVVIVQIFNAIAELSIPTGTPTNESNTEIETTTDSRNKDKKMIKLI